MKTSHSRGELAAIIDFAGLAIEKQTDFLCSIVEFGLSAGGRSAVTSGFREFWAAGLAQSKAATHSTIDHLDIARIEWTRH